MLLDRENLFSYKQAITATADSTDVVDLGPAYNWSGNANGVEQPIMLSSEDAFVSAGASTLQVELKSSATSDRANPKTHGSVTIAKADLVGAGPIQNGIILPVDVRRYVFLTYTVTNGPFTAGTITAGIVDGRQTIK